MANINNQGNWDALRQPNESRYLDNTPAETGGPILTEISATTVDIITPRGSSITTSSHDHRCCEGYHWLSS